MFRYCYVHKGYFGIKKPLLNMSVTGGICKRCLPGELEKFRIWKEKKDLAQLRSVGLGQRPSNGDSKKAGECVGNDLFSAYPKNID